MHIDTSKMKCVKHETDLCVVGGGLAGLVAAIAAAREGIKVVLIHDRPVLGGNASSEIRMWVRGAAGLHNRETGILSEIEEENIYRNPYLNFSIWDSVLWGKVKAEPNIELLLNCSCADAETKNGLIKSVTGWQLTTYTWHTVKAKFFADCSGDSVLAPLTGAAYRVGREASSEYGESIAPENSDSKTMGMSCLMQARQTDHPVKFIAPKWANIYPSDADFDYCLPLEENEKYALYRSHTMSESTTNFWWMELGGDADSIHDTEFLRDELIKVAFGIWDHIKNQGDHGADNWELEWVGFIPGKRESRRYIGEHVLTQHDIESEGRFDDIVAYGGWSMDDHHPGGLRSPLDQPPALQYPTPSPYGIPYRSLYSVNIGNLFFAGRNISATHAAISSTRVMATCAILGQAVGTAAAIAVTERLNPNGVYEHRIGILQSKLMDAGCYLPGHTREIPELSRLAKLNLTSSDRKLLFNGIERPDKDMAVNYIECELGKPIEYSFVKNIYVNELRILFDPDFSRMSISQDGNIRVFTQKCNTSYDFEPVKVAATLVKSFSVFLDGNLVYSTDNNYNSRFCLHLGCMVKNISVRFDKTWGADKAHIFSCDVK